MFTKLKTDAFMNLQVNAGIMCDSFDPATGVIGNILGLSTGGFQFASNPNYVDFGEDVDNAPANTWQLKRITYYDPAISGTFVSLDADLAMTLTGASVYGEDTQTIIPTHALIEDDFKDFWVIGDYGNDNSNAAKAGFVAIHLMNALNTAGLQWQTTKDGKGQFAFDFHGHYDMEDIDTVPFEIYVKEGTPDLAPLVVTSEAGASSGKSKITVSGYTPGTSESYVYQTATTTAPSVDYGDSVTGWTTLTNGNEITPTASHTKITVAVKDSNGKAIAAGSATLTIAS